MFEIIKNLFRKQTQVVVKESNQSGVVWSPHDFENFAKEAYLKNVIAFRCINEIAKATSSVPWKVFKLNADGKKVEQKNHPINKILNRPNPEEGWTFFIKKLMSFLELDGNSFVRRIAPITGPNSAIPQELHVLRPDRMKILEDDGILKGFSHKVGNNEPTIFLVDSITRQADVLQFKNFHPTDDWWGVAATQTAGREIDTSNEATKWNKALLENQGRPGLLYMIENELDKTSKKDLENQIRDKFQGGANAGRSFIIDGKGKVDIKPYGFNLNELDFTDGQKEIARKICMAYDVPPNILGISSETFNNYETALLAFWENTIIGKLWLLKTELNNWFFRDDEFFIDFILDKVPAFAAKRQLQWDRAQKSDFLMEDEKREMVGLDPLPGDIGQVVLKPATLLPLGIDLTGDNPEDEEDEEEKSEINKLFAGLDYE